MEPQKTFIEPTNKNHRILFTVITILLTAGIVGGSLYYVLNKQIKNQQQQIEELNKKVSKKTETKKKSSNTKTEEKKAETVTKAEEKVAPVETKKQLDIRTVDFSKIIETKPGLADLKPINYGDFNQDGKEEAIVIVSYSGTGGFNDFSVYGYVNDELKNLLWIPSADAKTYGSDNYKGGNSLKFTNNELTLSYPLYTEGDSECCPTGGKRYTYYKWNGSVFSPIRTEIKGE